MNPFYAWSSKAAPPKQPEKKLSSDDLASNVRVQRARDHSISHRHGIHPRDYPPDCPRLNVQWFHAVDVVKRKPAYMDQNKDEKLLVPPKKWNTFSIKDSKALEAAFLSLSDQDEDRATRESLKADLKDEPRSDEKPNRSLAADASHDVRSAKVPVNEDYLFDVDIRHRELAPAYWLGPIYEVRRGTWFYVDGSNLRPAEENLATQLEEGYLKTKPWRTTSDQNSSSPNLRPRSDSDALPSVGEPSSLDTLADSVKKSEIGPKENESASSTAKRNSTTLLTHRLFGAYMNSMVTYEDSATAWLLTDDFLSRMSSTVYQRFAGGAHFSGTKLVRGYNEIKKKPTKEKRPGTPPGESPTKDSKNKDHARRRSAPPSAAGIDEATGEEEEAESEAQPESRVRVLERQMSNLVAAAVPPDPKLQDEEARRREEREIQDDYQNSVGDDQDRDIEHLILVTHGIGQRLGARFETFNFIHDVNELRKTLKSVYNASPDLQALNSEVDSSTKNCKIQVLPIVWRHNLDFPHQGVKHNRKEHDIADVNSEEDDEYPNLQAITIDGVPALRNIIADLALDILLYQTPAYKDHISRIVVKECNRIMKLFKKRNPNFKGRVSLIGHSLGSAIMFDVLAEQPEDAATLDKHGRHRHTTPNDIKLAFEVEDFICLGSPIGLFQMLKGKTIGARLNPNKVTLDGSVGDLDDPLNDMAFPARLPAQALTDDRRQAIMSTPKCKQLFNIFHPSDPISYRLEPLISPAMSSMKPQPLPYTKRNFFNGAIGQGITGIPAKVGQSFSGFWTNFSSSLTNNFINRSLGISAEDAARLRAPPKPAGNANVQQLQELRDSAKQKGSQSPMSVGAGTNAIGGGVIPKEFRNDPRVAELEDERKRKLAQDASEKQDDSQRPPTLIDAELETLWGGFQKRRKSAQENDSTSRDLGESPAWREAEERERKLKKEEAKLRALNRNGRVDYNIQEGAFDISFLASIASHLAYWTDEDVCHFMTSQLLSKPRTLRKSKSMTQG